MRCSRHIAIVFALVLAAVSVLALASPAFATSKTKTYIEGTPSASAVITKPVSHKVSGTLTYAKGKKRPALARQAVKVYRYKSGKWSVLKTVKTNSKGKFSMVVPTGYRYQVKYAGTKKYKATASAKFTVRRPTVVPPRATPPSAPPVVMPNPILSVYIDLGFGGSTEFPVEEGVWGFVTKGVTSSNEDYLGGVTVRVGDRTAVTDTDGFWYISGLPVGRYVAQVVVPDYIYQGVHYQLKSNEPAFSVVPELDKYICAETTRSKYGVDSSADTVNVTGTVRVADENDAPVPNVTVSVHSYGDGTLLGTSAPTDANGEWSINDVPAGDYWTEVNASYPFEFVHGDVHYKVGGWFAWDFSVGVGPTLWEPSTGAVPPTGNYVYLDSDAGDWVGQGREYLFTPADAQLTVSASGGLLSVGVRGDELWGGQFQTPNTTSKLEPGYYPDLARWSFDDPAKGGLDWSGDGRGSRTLTGWFIVDSVTYVDDVLTAIDLRFEQHSDGEEPALHGAIHWTADDPTQPPGPVNPFPDGVWEPSAGAVPTTGNYVYLDSDPGDYIGGGGEYHYTNSNVRASGGRLSVDVGGWHGEFLTMSTLTDFKPGYYPDLLGYPVHNPAKGGLSWSGQGRGSNALTGWFIVDSVTYVDGVLRAIDLRFEQHSEGEEPALHGAIRWTDGFWITPTAGAHGAIIPGTQHLVAPGESRTFTIIPDPGYHVADVKVDGVSVGARTEYTFTNTTANHTISATFSNTYTIVGSAGANGSVTSNTPQDVTHGGSKTFAIRPASGYRVADVKIDGVSIGGVTSYTFSNVTANHTISASFAVLPKVSLGAPVAPKTMKRTRSYTVYGSLKPKHTSGTKPVRIYKYKKVGGRWVKKGYVKAKAYNYKGYTRYKVKMKLTSKGSWRLRACAPADSKHALTWSSKYDYVKVR